MLRAVSRLVVRLAIVAASLAWAGFVFTNTVGDPGRGERIATAVLEDDAARAEVVAPIASAVVRNAGIPATQQPAVAVQVDALLQDPATARTFVDPFAGQWARMLGADDARPVDYDVGPILDQILAATPGVGVPVGDQGAAIASDALVVPAVPLPRAQFDWMVPSRNTVTRATAILASLAAVGFAVGFAIGDRRWVLRRVGAWATLAGAVWVVVPAVAVWAARRWATGADSIIAVAVEEAVSGLQATSLVLLAAGLVAFAGSFTAVPAWSTAPARTPQPSAPPADGRQRPGADRFAPSGPPALADDPRLGYGEIGRRHRLRDVATAATAIRPDDVPIGARAASNGVTSTAEMPIADRPTGEIPVIVTDDLDRERPSDAHNDPLWNFYS